MLVTMTTHLGKTWENHFAKAEIFGIYIVIFNVIFIMTNRNMK